MFEWTTEGDLVVESSETIQQRQPEGELEAEMPGRRPESPSSSSASESEVPDNKNAAASALPVEGTALANIPPSTFLNEFHELLELVAKTPEELVSHPWADSMSAILKTTSEHLATAVTTPHPAAYLIAKNHELLWD